MRDWNLQGRNREARLARAARLADGKRVVAEDARSLLEAVLEPGDRVCLEGNNQKQADFLAKTLASVDPAQVHDLHMVQSVLALPEHLDVFERGIASKLDFSFSGPQAGRLANLAGAGRISIGAIHTYLELFGRYFVDLTPRVSLVAAQAADAAGNHYTGPNTEDTPVIVEATAFKRGIVIAQVNELSEALPRVDIPGDWVDFVIVSPTPAMVVLPRLIAARPSMSTTKPQRVRPFSVISPKIASTLSRASAVRPAFLADTSSFPPICQVLDVIAV